MIFSPFVQQVSQEWDQYVHQASEYFQTILVTFWWFVNAFDAHGGAITGAATIVLAFSTFFLWRITRRQVRDTRILQRAYLSADLGGITWRRTRGATYCSWAC